MNKTRWSLLYLATYLTVIGFGMLFAPHTTLNILQSTGDYGDVFPRVAGMLMSGLGLAVAGMIRANTVELYPATLAIRIYFLVCIAIFYGTTKDMLFIVMLIIVGFGFLLTLASYFADRRATG